MGFMASHDVNARARAVYYYNCMHVYIISDGCDDDMFTCKNGECIFPYFKCDLQIDCSDGSDEECGMYVR